MDFEFECQFAYITSDTEQQTTPSSASSGGDVGNEAKRLKQERGAAKWKIFSVYVPSNRCHQLNQLIQLCI